MGGEILFCPTEHFLELHGDLDLKTLEWPAAEQTNSTMIVGRQVVIKLLRRLGAGNHPEGEMSRYLTDNGFTGTPALFGEMLRTEAQGTTATIVIAQAYVPNQGDGWAWTLDHLERLVDERATPFADEKRDGFEQYELFAQQTGKRVGDMHSILARPSSNPSFTPEEIASARASAIGTRILAQLDAAIAAVRTARDSEALGLLGLITDRREALGKVVCQRAENADRLLRTRIHGDLHLGQLLVAGEDVKIIDFEGEPAKSLEERRRKYLPLRDLAGMLRSFSYVAAQASRANKQSGAEGKTRVDTILREFLSTARRGFLEGYAEGRGQELTPAELALLDILMLEKAAYEVCYEAANRPGWLLVPLEGLASLTDSLLAQELANV